MTLSYLRRLPLLRSSTSNALLLLMAVFFYRVAQGTVRDPSDISTEFGETFGFSWLFAALFIRNVVVDPMFKRFMFKRLMSKHVTSRPSGSDMSRRNGPTSVFLLAAGLGLIAVEAYFLHAHETTLLGFALACCAAAPLIGFGIWYGRRVHS